MHFCQPPCSCEQVYHVINFSHYCNELIPLNDIILTCTLDAAFELKGVITVLSEQFERDGVIVTLGIEENTLYESYVSANPQLISDSVISIIDRATFQIKILYNIMYNVSVVAAHLCGRNNVTTFIDLYYSKIITCTPVRLIQI